MITFIRTRRQERDGRRLGLLLSVSYLLFALAPFLLIHSHIESGETGHKGSHVETTHAHAWEFWAHDDHEDEEAAGQEHDREHHHEAEGHSTFHLGEFAGDHEGMEVSPWSLLSTTFRWVPFSAAVVLYPEVQFPLPVPISGYPPGRIPILSEPVSKRISSCLHGDLPPPSVA